MEIYYHPTCLSSYKLIKGLYEEGYLDKVNLINTANDFSRALDKGVISVPYVFVKGRPSLVDPVTHEEVMDLLTGKKRGPLSLEEAASNFVRAVMASSFAVTGAVIRGSFSHLLRGNFLKAASKASLYEPSFSFRELTEFMRKNDSRLFEENRDRMVRTVAYDIVRISFWSGNTRLEENSVKMLLLSRGSLGRVAIPYPVGINESLVASIMEVIRSRYEKYVEMLRQERNEITSDHWYEKFL
mgnify:CR=1 FL=1